MRMGMLEPRHVNLLPLDVAELRELRIEHAKPKSDIGKRKGDREEKRK
jgi:hypothetical protein